MSKLNPTQQLMRDTIIPQAMKEFESVVDKSSFFEFYCAQQYLKQYELTDEEIENGIIGGSDDGGCDGMYLFLNSALVTDETLQSLPKMRVFDLDLYLFQAKNSPGFDETVILKFKTLSENLLTVESKLDKFKGRYSESLCGKVQEFLDLYKKIVTKIRTLKIHFVYASLGSQISRDIEAQADELRLKCREQFPIAEITVTFVGAETLFDLSRQNPNPYRNLKLQAQPIGTLKEQGYVALVRLNDYYNFITDEGRMLSGLLDSNVRDYQGLTVVNKAIFDTLEKEEKEEFWWFNNGVTILARGIELVSQIEFRLDDPKIVNGLQTSREVFNYFTKDPDSITRDTRSVLVRVISTEDEDVRDKIILATNSQTTIPPASLRATDPIHLKIELYCKKKGLYYDRRKNQYRNQGKRLNDIVSIGFMGQCLISLLMQRPDAARARPSTVLADDDAYTKLFNKDFSLEMYYRTARAGRKISELLWKCDWLTRPQRTNIFYYVIYAVCARIIGRDKIYACDLENLDIDKITQEYVYEVIRFVLDVFVGCGESDKVAKGPDFIIKLQNTLISSKWIISVDSRKNDPITNMQGAVSGSDRK